MNEVLTQQIWSQTNHHVFVFMFYTVSNDLLRWRSALRSTQEQFCTSIVPSDLLLHLTDIVSPEDEQVIKTKEANEGPIRASRLLVDCLLRCIDTRWPDVLMSALENYGCRTLADLLSDKSKNRPWSFRNTLKTRSRCLHVALESFVFPVCGVVIHFVSDFSFHHRP